MATQPILTRRGALRLQLIASLPAMRALAWSGDTLYASRGYGLHSAEIIDDRIVWRHVAGYRPAWWRRLTSRNRLTFRLVRDGFHALATLPGGTRVGAFP